MLKRFKSCCFKATCKLRWFNFTIIIKNIEILHCNCHLRRNYPLVSCMSRDTKTSFRINLLYRYSNRTLLFWLSIPCRNVIEIWSNRFSSYVSRIKLWYQVAEFNWLLALVSSFTLTLPVIWRVEANWYSMLLTKLLYLVLSIYQKIC